MWGRGYWGATYWADEYWPTGTAGAPIPTPVVPATGTGGPRPRRRKIILDHLPVLERPPERTRSRQVVRGRLHLPLPQWYLAGSLTPAKGAVGGSLVIPLPLAQVMWTGQVVVPHPVQGTVVVAVWPMTMTAMISEDFDELLTIQLALQEED